MQWGGVYFGLTMRLIVVRGPLEGTEIPIDRFPVSIGRSGGDADLVLDTDPRISRMHCRLHRQDEQVWLEDLGSNNGTWVGQERLEGRIRIARGATFKIGDTKVCVDDDATPVAIADEHPDEDATTRTSDPATNRIQLADIADAADDTTTQSPMNVTAQFRINPVELARLQSRLRTLLKLAEASTGQTDLESLFALAADGILDASLAKRAVVLLPDADGTLLPVVVRTRDDDKTIVISRTIVDQAVRDKMTVLVQDTAGDDKLSIAESVRMAAIRSAICVPMMFEGQVKAVIYADASLPRAFSEDELDLMTAIGNQAAVAMAAANLSADLERVCTQLKGARARQENLLETFKQMSRTG